MHHTKEKGDLGVLKAQCACAEQGFAILIPLSEHKAYDFVIEKENRFRRVQAKYRSKSSNGTLNVAFKSCWSDKHGTHFQAVDKLLVDVYAVYCPDTDKTYFFDPKQFGKSISLRVDTPKNNQNANVKFAENYCQVP